MEEVCFQGLIITFLLSLSLIHFYFDFGAGSNRFSQRSTEFKSKFRSKKEGFRQAVIDIQNRDIGIFPPCPDFIKAAFLLRGTLLSSNKYNYSRNSAPANEQSNHPRPEICAIARLRASFGSRASVPAVV